MVSAKVIVASFTGIQLISEADSGRADLREQVAEMWRHLLPSIAHPGVIAHIKPEGRVDLAAQAREMAEQAEREAREIAAAAEAARGSAAAGPRNGGGGQRGGAGRGTRDQAEEEGADEPAGAGATAGGRI